MKNGGNGIMSTQTLKLSSGITGFYNEKNEWQATGSQMGRRNEIPNDYAGEPLVITKLLLDEGYDFMGAYWGSGVPIWIAWGESETEQVRVYIRAKNREAAKATFLAILPNATFSR